MMIDKKIKATEILIIGGGPSGLSLALGLAKQGVRSILIEKKTGTSKRSKAPVVHQRTQEILQQWGVRGKFLLAGNLREQVKVKTHYKDKLLFSLDFRKLKDESDRPGILILRQSETERLLLQAVKNSGMCETVFGAEAVSVKQHQDDVQEKVITGDTEEQEFSGRYLIGCDGASSFVRNSTGFDFKGKTYRVRTVLADIEIQDERNDLMWPRFYNGRGEVSVGIQLSPGLWRLIHLESGNSGNDNKENISKEEVAVWMEQVMGKGEFQLVWASPFKIHRRSSPEFRKGKVLLAGDAAHIHSPVGGQGMNAGIQDAHNLAWKLAYSLKSRNIENLLDSFNTERKAAVVDQVSKYTDFMTRAFLQSPKIFRTVSFFMLRRILSVPYMRRKFLCRTAMINTRYPKSEICDNSTPAAGRRLPNVLLKSSEGKTIRIYELLSLQLTILSVGEEQDLNFKIRVIKINREAYGDASGMLQKLLKKKSGFILVRPDHHIAWTGKSSLELEKAIALICGP